MLGTDGTVHSCGYLNSSGRDLNCRRSYKLRGFVEQQKDHKLKHNLLLAFVPPFSGNVV